MKPIFSKIQRLSINQLIGLLSLISMLLAFQLHYIQLGAINNDFVLYHEAARLIAVGEWQSAFSLFGWPLYSLLIASLNTLTGLSLQTSAQILSVIFFGLATSCFLKIIHMLGGDSKAILSGALILFSSQYIVGDVLPMLVRDHGFWAFFLLSLVFFIRFYQSKNTKDALFWQLSIIIATLFRIEGITYLMLLPLLLLFSNHTSWGNRLGLLLKAQSINLAIAFSAGIAIATLESLSIDQFGRLKEIFSLNLYQELTAKFIYRSEIMATSVLGNHLEEFAHEGLLLVFVSIIVTKIISTSGWISIGLAIMTFRKKWAELNPHARQVLMAGMSIALLNMLLIITKVFVLSGRYVAAFSFLVMIFAAFYMAHIWRYIVSDTKGTQYKKWIVVALLIIMGLSLVKNTLPKVDGSNFEQDAIAWLKQNSSVDGKTYFSTPRLRFYANHNFTDLDRDSWQTLSEAISNQSIFAYQRLVILIDELPEARTKELTEALSGYVIAKEFYSPKNKKKVVIFVRS